MQLDHSGAQPSASKSPFRIAEERFQCSHPERELRTRTLSNGALQYVRQCVTCGDSGQAIRKDAASSESALAAIPPYDEALLDKWYAQRRSYAEDVRTQQSEAWFAEHNEYTRSAPWRRRRGYVLARDNYRCQAFIPGCTRKAEEVNHLTYIHWKNEPLYDLISVCRFCHEQITRMDRERRGVAA